MGYFRTRLALSIIMCIVGACAADILAGFGSYEVLYWPQNIGINAQLGEMSMTMTNTSGAAYGASMQGWTNYKYGSFSVKMKLINGQQDSSGTVCSFYLTSPRTGLLNGTTDWDEIDFEFLGNQSGQPMLLHTNLFVDGIGQREQRIEFWFDPTTEYHSYSAIWNHQEIVWLVDDIPIRVHFNVKDPATGVQNVFPSKAMIGAASIFEASNWATRGGAIPIDPAAQPWTVYYEDFDFQACEVIDGNTSACEVGYQNNWWESGWNGLNATQKNLVNWVRSHYMVSDYCSPSWYNYNATQSLIECNVNTAMLA